MPNEKVKRFFRRLRTQEQDLNKTLHSFPTQRNKPRTEFSWNDLKLNLKLLLRADLTQSVYDKLVSPLSLLSSDKELYIRWLQSICLLPLFREPVGTDEAADLNSQTALVLRHSLMPYLKSVLALSHEYKWPIVSSIDKIEPENAKVYGIIDCYGLGNCLLVAPVVNPDVTHRYVYLPVGQWYEFGTSSLLEGGQYVQVAAPVQSLPLFVKAGTVLPMRKRDAIGEVTSAAELVYRIYPGNLESVQYEDDVEVPDKERSDYRWIYSTCGWEDDTLIIKRRIAGQYLPTYKQIRIEIVGLAHEPHSISIDRRPAPLWYFDDGIVEFTTDTFQLIEIKMGADAD